MAKPNPNNSDPLTWPSRGAEAVEIDLGPPVTSGSHGAESGLPLDTPTPLAPKGDALDAFRSRSAVGKSREQRARPAQSGPRFPAQSHENLGGQRPPSEEQRPRRIGPAVPRSR